MSECVVRGVDRCPPKGRVPLGTYRVKETRGLIDGMETRSLIDGMGTVRLAETNGHNESIEGHVMYSMPCNSPWEVTWSNLGESRDSMGTDHTHEATYSIGCPNP